MGKEIDTLLRRIELKKQLIMLTEKEIKELEIRILRLTITGDSPSADEKPDS